MRQSAFIHGLLVAALLTSCGGVAPTASRQQTTVPVTATPGTPGPVAMATVSGTLTFVDSSRRIINVTGQSGAVLVLSVAPAAVVVVDEAVTALDELGDRIGSNVTAMYNPANNIATSVEVSR